MFFFHDSFVNYWKKQILCRRVERILVSGKQWWGLGSLATRVTLKVVPQQRFTFPVSQASLLHGKAATSSVLNLPDTTVESFSRIQDKSHLGTYRQPRPAWENGGWLLQLGSRGGNQLVLLNEESMLTKQVRVSTNTSGFLTGYCEIHSKMMTPTFAVYVP